MGGGGGGSSSIGNIQSLVDKAKQELRKSEQQGEKRNVFISFAYEDINQVNLLRGQAKNDNSPIEFNDWSVSEPIDSERAQYIKQKITERIEQSSLTVVFLSDAAVKSKWVTWEIEKSLEMGKQVLGVYPKDAKPYVYPDSISANKIKCVPWPGLASAIANLK